MTKKVKILLLEISFIRVTIKSGRHDCKVQFRSNLQFRSKPPSLYDVFSISVIGKLRRMSVAC